MDVCIIKTKIPKRVLFKRKFISVFQDQKCPSEAPPPRPPFNLNIFKSSLTKVISLCHLFPGSPDPGLSRHGSDDPSHARCLNSDEALAHTAFIDYN